MENNNKIINRINFSKYSKQNINNTNENNKIKSYTSYNISKRMNTEINNTINSRNNDNNGTLTKNLNSNKNFLLARKYQIKTPNENIKINYNMNNLNRENNHNINENKRTNHYIFVRKESKKENQNTYNNSTYSNKENNSSKFNQNQNTNYLNQNNISIKPKTAITNFQNYRKISNQRITQDTSFQSNYNKDSKTNNNLINKENSEINKENKNYTNTNITFRRFSRNNIQNKDIAKEPNINNKTEEKEEEKSLMDIVNKQIGIKNIGNTCFINSSLQIFIHCPLFISKLINKMKLINENTQVTSNFLSICNLMLNTKSKYISIYSFKSLLGLKHKIFFGHMQNDSQEFIRIFVEDISQELNEAKENSIFRLLSNSDTKSKLIRDEDFHINFSRREKSIITEIFYAQIVNIYTCRCNSMIFSFQKILDFPLLFPEKINNNMISLYELLKLYFNVEYIEFESKCERCRKIEKHKKELKISRPPEILILSLQRVDLITGKKLEYRVKFSQKLDLYEFTDHDCGYDHECKYELFGVINHRGNLDSGHYFSYIKNENKEWIEYNDSFVRKINYFSDCSDSVYALFYIKEKYNNMNLFKQ